MVCWAGRIVSEIGNGWFGSIGIAEVVNGTGTVGRLMLGLVGEADAGTATAAAAAAIFCFWWAVAADC